MTDNLFIICDGMYARHQKSTNNEYQVTSFGEKESPSLQILHYLYDWLTFVFDRGLEKKKFKVLMPALKDKRKELRAEESKSV